MSALDALRCFNLFTIGASIGFVVALAVSHRQSVPRYVYGLGVSYGLFAIGSMVEIELALRSDAPFTWRTVIVTCGALTGVVTAFLAWVGSGD